MRWIVVALMVAGCRPAMVVPGQRNVGSLYERVHVVSTPPGAEVCADDDERTCFGKTPTDVAVPFEGEGRVMRLMLDGYLPATVTVSHTQAEVSVALTVDPHPPTAATPPPKRRKLCPKKDPTLELLRPPGYVSEDEKEDCIPR